MLAMIEDTPTDDFLDELVTATQAAAEFGITTQAINNWVRRRYLAVAGFDADNRRLYRKLDLEKVNHATKQRMLGRRR